MNNPYDVHSWSRLYREEALQEARRRHLEGQLRENGKVSSGRTTVIPTLAKVLSLVRGA